MLRGLSSVATRSCKKARIRRRGWSSLSKSRTAAWSSSIVHAIACHHVFERDGVRFAEPAPFSHLEPTMPPTSFDIGFSLNPCPRKLGGASEIGSQPSAVAAWTAMCSLVQ